MKNEQQTAKANVDEQLMADKFYDKAWLIVGAVLLFAAFAYRANFEGPLSNDQGVWGQFGDFFAGILNPLISFLTLLVASKVWQLQQRELRETKKTLEQQVTQSTLANQREEQKKDEQLFFLILDKVNSSAIQVNNGVQQTGPVRYIDLLAEEVWNFAPSTGPAAFSDSYNSRAQGQLDEAIKSFEPKLASYVHMVMLALRVLSTRISDKKLFSEIFFAQIGRSQLSLLCYLSCATEYAELKSLMQSLSLHRYLPKNQYDDHVRLGWFNSLQE
jgi:hypothetical protein